MTTTELQAGRLRFGERSLGDVRTRWSWLAIPLAIGIASRAFSALLLSQQQRAAATLPLLQGYTSPFASWDAQWYIHIATWGYHAFPIQLSGPQGGHRDFAFYPGWPLLIRIVSLNAILPDRTAVLLANFLFLLAAIALYNLFSERFSQRTALWATLLLAFNPVAYVFSMAYSEALFVLIVGLYFLDRQGRSSPILAAAATLTRVSGLAIGAAASVTALFGPGRSRAFQICVAVALAFGAWWTYIWLLTGDFFGWFEGSPDWSRSEGIDSILRELRIEPDHALAWLSFVALMIVGSALLLRSHREMAIFGLGAIAMSLIGAPTSSMPRHAMIAVPAFAAIAGRLGPRLSAVLLVVFMVGQVYFVNFAFAGLVRNPP